MARVVLTDGQLTEEDKYRRICIQLLALFHSHPATLHTLAKISFTDQNEQSLPTEDNDILKRFGILQTRPGLFITEPDGTTWARTHTVLTEETKSIIRTALQDQKQDLFHKINIVMPAVIPSINLVA